MPLPMCPKEENKPLSEISNVIAVAAGKGGVGKSTVAVNLALALSRKGFKVGILDADVYGPSLRKMLPEDQMPNQEGNIIYPAASQGIRMISLAYFRRNNEAAIVRAPIANGVISQFLHNVAWGALDYLFIDFPPGTGDVQLTLCQQAKLTAAIVVTTPQEVALLDVRKAISMFNQVKVPILGVIENMSYYLLPGTSEKVYIFGKDGGERLAKESSVPFLGGIPIDPELCKCGDQGNAALLYQGDNERPSVTAFMDIASQAISRAQSLNAEMSKGVSDFEITWRNATS